MNCLDILVEQERRRGIIELLRILVSLRLPNGKPCLDLRDRRILHMYPMGYATRAIGSKIGIDHKAVQRRLERIHGKILRCQGGHLADWDVLLRPPQSDKEADVPEVMLRWYLDFAETSFVDHGWNVKGESKGYSKVKPKGRSVWEAKTACRVPEYFHECFGDNVTRCTLCGAMCTRRKDHV